MNNANSTSPRLIVHIFKLDSQPTYLYDPLSHFPIYWPSVADSCSRFILRCDISTYFTFSFRLPLNPSRLICYFRFFASDSFLFIPRLQPSPKQYLCIWFLQNSCTNPFFYSGYPLSYSRIAPNPNVQLKCNFSLQLLPLSTYPQVSTTLSTNEDSSQQRRPLLSAPPTTFQTQDHSPSQMTWSTASNSLQHQRQSLELVRPAETLRWVTRNLQIQNQLMLTHTVLTIPPFLHISTPYISLPLFVL